MASSPTSAAPEHHGPLATAGAIWGVVGVSVLLLGGVFSVLPHALELEASQLGWVEGSVLAVFCTFMAVGKGYFGFQRSFSPRTAERALEIAGKPRPWAVALAPLYAMCLIMAPGPRLVRSWALVFAIAAIVPLVGILPQPWRGIVDIGVIVGLSWGLVSFWVSVARARQSSSVS